MQTFYRLSTSSDTVGRSGMYCAISNALEQCKAEGVVDVFQVVKAIRMQKPGAVTTQVKWISLTLSLKINFVLVGAIQPHF